MNIKENDRQYRQIMKSIKVRQEMIDTATTDAEKRNHTLAMSDLMAMLTVLNRRL